MSSMKQMHDAMTAITSRLDALNTRFAALDTEIAVIKKMAKGTSKSESDGEVKVKKERKKTAKPSKSEADTEADEPKEKPKREVKPSAARDAWRSLCDAVRAVHKKDAMRIAKILKEQGHMTPTTQQIEAAIAEIPTSETPMKVSATDGEGSDTATSTKKRVRTKKEKVVSE